MAIDYSKLFQSAGPFMKNANDLGTTNAALNARQSAIETELVSHGAYYTRFADGLSNYTAQVEQANLQLVSTNIQKVISLLTDDELVFKQLPITDKDLATLLPALYKDMQDESETVLNSVLDSSATVTSFTEDYENSDAGTLIVWTRLDGVVPPIADGIVNRHWLAANTQLATPGAIRIVCTDDSVDGNESWTIFGKLQDIPFGKDTESPNGNLTFRSGTGVNSLSNGSLDAWSGVTPTGWDVIPDSTITKSQETTIVLRETGSSLKLTDFASYPVVTKQQITNVIPGRYYSLSCYVRVVAGTIDTDVTIGLYDSSGATLATEVTDTITGTTDSDWILVEGFRYVPFGTDITDCFLRVTITANNAAGDDVYIDQVVLTPVNYYEGLGYVIIPGVERFTVGDKIEGTVSYTSEGVVQTFMRKAFNFQLNSAASSETISDAWVA